MNSAMMKEIERLRSKHEIYDQFYMEWSFYLDIYEGGADVLNTRHIFPHVRENKEDYLDRVKRCHYLNYAKPLIKFFTNFIFAETIQRNGGSEEAFFQEFKRDVNKKSEGIDTFMSQVADQMQLYGMLYILVDSPRPIVPLVSRLQEEEQGIRPYWVKILPDEIYDWSVNNFGKYQYVKRRHLEEVLISNRKVVFEKFTEYFADATVVTTVDNTKPDEPEIISTEVFPNKSGKIPLVQIRYEASERYPEMGLSFIRDISRSNRNILNLTSLIGEFLYRQCFNLLAKETEMAIPLASQNEGEVGTSNVLEIPKGAAMPQYITPPVDPAEFLQSERNSTVQAIFTLAAQDMMRELFNGQGASGFSQAQSFSRTVPFIATRAEVLERAENQLMDLTMQFRGKHWDGKIKYKDRYEITNVSDAITQLTSLFRDLNMPSETFAKEELKRLVHEYDGKIPDDIMVTILSEIDKMNFPEWRKLVVGQGKPSPAAQNKNKNTGTMEEIVKEAVKGKKGASKKMQEQ